MEALITSIILFLIARYTNPATLLIGEYLSALVNNFRATS
ncbi:hypothetical protein WPG_2517 [Winogradskyella sp. PG-2]|nr:hypothetical protein WPG_2517 [Winogradskyella sp. PG-2]